MLAQTLRPCHHAIVLIALIGAAAAYPMAEPRQLSDLPSALAATMREARTEAERVAAASPDAARRSDAWGNLGMLYHAHRLRFLAQDAYARALVEAESVRWRYLHGIALSELGEIERAAADFRLVTKAAPKEVPAWYRLGVALLLTGDVDGAQVALDEARSLDADSALVLAALADVASARQDHRTALDLLKRAFELEPEAGQLAYKLAMAQRAMGDAEAAAAWLARRPDNSLAPKIDDPVLLEVAGMSRSSRFYEIAADWALGRGDTGGAVDALKRASTLAPEDVGLVLRLASVLDDAGRQDEAVAATRKALALDEGSSAGWYRLAWLLRTSDDPDDRREAEDAVHRALGIAEEARALALAAAFDMRDARFGTAADRYARLAVLRPGDAYAHYWLAMARAGAEDCAAREAFADALRLAPDWGEAHIALARTDALCDFAEASLQRAASLRGVKDDSGTRVTQAFALAATDRWDDASKLAASALPHADAAHLLAALANDTLPAKPFAPGADWWLPPEIR